MWNTFLNNSDSGVITDTAKPNNSYDGYVKAAANNEFIWGMLLGFSLAILLFVIYKISKRIIKKIREEYDTIEDD